MKLFKFTGLLFLILFIFSKSLHSANDETTIYEKIDIFSDVLDKMTRYLSKLSHLNETI